MALHAPSGLVAVTMGNTPWGVVIRAAIAPLVTVRRLTLSYSREGKSRFSNWQGQSGGRFRFETTNLEERGHEVECKWNEKDNGH
jgi:hypothetical protein